jgi:hypothetical protein
MARILLHIGANKTGSSAVQDFLRRNYKTLLAHGLLVADKELASSDRVTGEHVFAFQDFFNRSDRGNLEARLRALSRENARMVLLSAENLSNGANFQFFKQALTGLDCKVLLYIRRQDELLTSSWQQWNSKREVDFDAWLVLALQRHGHWQRCIEGWEGVAGPGNVIIRVFQGTDLVRGDVVDDYISQLDFDGPAPQFTRAEGLVNPSYSDVITPMVSGSKFLFASEHDNDFYTMVGKLTGKHYATQKKVSLLSREQRNKIIEFYRLQNEHICRRYFPGRPRLFEPVDHGKYEYLTPEELMRRQLEFVTSLIYAMYKRLP